MAQNLWDCNARGAIENYSPVISHRTISPEGESQTSPPGRDPSNVASDRPDTRRSRSGKLSRSNSRLTTVTQSVPVTQYRQSADKTLRAMFLVEEACLTALLEHPARTSDEDGISAQEIAERIGLVRYLGPSVSEAVISKVLCNLSKSDRAEPTLEAAAAAKWRIGEVEAGVVTVRYNLC